MKKAAVKRDARGDGDGAEVQTGAVSKLEQTTGETGDILRVTPPPHPAEVSTSWYS